LYFSYTNDRNPNRPRWLPARHVIADTDNPNRWLITDWFARDGESLHRVSIKTLNYLCVDGHVKLLLAHPQPVFLQGES
jgi:hypothetical protein